MSRMAAPGRGYYAHAPGKEGQRPFPGLVEDTFGRELLLQLLDAFLQLTLALEAHGGHVELAGAALLEDGDPSEGEDAHALLQPELQALVGEAEEGGRYEGIFVLQAEVYVPRGVIGEIGYLTLHPYAGEIGIFLKGVLDVPG